MPDSPLIITADDELLDQALTAAAAAGAEAMVSRDITAALPSWRAASLILLGVDQAPELLTRRPRPERPIQLLGDHHDRPELCTLSAQLSAAVVVLPDNRAALTSSIRHSWAETDTGRLIAVRGASGGVGASTIAAGLAWRAQDAGSRTALIDLDPAGGGLDLALGLEAEPGWRWPRLAGVQGQVSDLDTRLPRLEGLAVLSADRDGPPVMPSVQDVLDVLAACQQQHGFVVVDLGRALPDSVTGEVLSRAHRTVLPVRDEVRSVAAASAAIGTFADDNADWAPVLCRGPGSGLPADAVTDALGLEVGTTMPHDRRLRASQVRGEPPGPAAGRSWRRQLDRLWEQVRS